MHLKKQNITYEKLKSVGWIKPFRTPETMKDQFPYYPDLKNLCEAEETKYVAIAVLLSLLAMMLLLDSFLEIGRAHV